MLGITGKLGTHVIQAPSGRFVFVGDIPAKLCTKVPATKGDVMGGRAFREGGELLTYKAPSYATREDAIAAAAGIGVKVVA